MNKEEKEQFIMVDEFVDYMILDKTNEDYICGHELKEVVQDWHFLHCAWEKFRNIQFDKESFKHQEYKIICQNLRYTITDKEMIDVFHQLVVAIKWYNDCENLKK